MWLGKGGDGALAVERGDATAIGRGCDAYVVGGVWSQAANVQDNIP